VLKEMQVAFLNGLVLGSLLFLFVFLWRHDVELGALLWTSLMLTILVASLIGSSLPLLLHRWRVDPAVATGPFITVSNDVIGMAIYLTLATAYLRSH
jgi:magnesium transporter